MSKELNFRRVRRRNETIETKKKLKYKTKRMKKEDEKKITPTLHGNGMVIRKIFCDNEGKGPIVLFQYYL